MAVRRFLSRNAYIARMQNVGPPVRRIASFPTADVRSGSYSYPVRSVCKATLVGRTGAAPRHYEFQHGASSLLFNVATSEGRVQDGARDPELKTQWNRVVVAENVPGFEQILKDLEPGALVYVEGNLKVTKKHSEDGEYSEFVNVHVTKSQGTFRVLSRGQQAESEGMPF